MRWNRMCTLHENPDGQASLSTRIFVQKSQGVKRLVAFDPDIVTRNNNRKQVSSWSKIKTLVLRKDISFYTLFVYFFLSLFSFFLFIIIPLIRFLTAFILSVEKNRALIFIFRSVQRSPWSLLSRTHQRKSYALHLILPKQWQWYPIRILPKRSK